MGPASEDDALCSQAPTASRDPASEAVAEHCNGLTTIAGTGPPGLTARGKAILADHDQPAESLPREINEWWHGGDFSTFGAMAGGGMAAEPDAEPDEEPEPATP